MEALLPEEALDDDFKSFDMAVRVLTLKDYDYLDFRNEAFDKDYVDFLTRMDTLTERLQVNWEFFVYSPISRFTNLKNLENMDMIVRACDYLVVLSLGSVSVSGIGIRLGFRSRNSDRTETEPNRDQEVFFSKNKFGLSYSQT